MRKIAVIAIALVVSILLSAQQNIPSSEILLKLKKLNKIGTSQPKGYTKSSCSPA